MNKNLSSIYWRKVENKQSYFLNFLPSFLILNNSSHKQLCVISCLKWASSSAHWSFDGPFSNLFGFDLAQQWFRDVVTPIYVALHNNNSNNKTMIVLWLITIMIIIVWLIINFSASVFAKRKSEVLPINPNWVS